LYAFLEIIAQRERIIPIEIEAVCLWPRNHLHDGRVEIASGIAKSVFNDRIWTPGYVVLNARRDLSRPWRGCKMIRNAINDLFCLLREIRRLRTRGKRSARRNCAYPSEQELAPFHGVTGRVLEISAAQPLIPARLGMADDHAR
jgi:hypothetical protein